LKLLLDENLPPAFARSLDALSAHEAVSVAHVRDFFGAGTSDTKWIREVGEDGGWAIVSGDRRMLTREHELLALRQWRLTTFILAAGWKNMKFWDRAWLLVRWWPQVIATAAGHPAGTIFVIPHHQRPAAMKPQR
jgi:hypothetical protein